MLWPPSSMRAAGLCAGPCWVTMDRDRASPPRTETVSVLDSDDRQIGSSSGQLRRCRLSTRIAASNPHQVDAPRRTRREPQRQVVPLGAYLPALRILDNGNGKTPGQSHAAPPAGFEPAHPAPEAGALSPELRRPGEASLASSDQSFSHPRGDGSQSTP